MRFLMIVRDEILRRFHISQAEDLAQKESITVEFCDTIGTARYLLFIEEDVNFDAIAIAGFGNMDRYHIIRFAEDVKASKFSGQIIISSVDPKLVGEMKSIGCIFINPSPNLVKDVIMIVENQKQPLMV